jgi:hypothetical protein
MHYKVDIGLAAIVPRQLSDLLADAKGHINRNLWFSKEVMRWKIKSVLIFGLESRKNQGKGSMPIGMLLLHQ